MDQDGGLILSRSSQPIYKSGLTSTEALIKQQKPLMAVDSAVLDRLAKMKISDKKMDLVKIENQIEDNTISSSMSVSSGIGSGELSPTSCVTKSTSNVFLENAAEKNAEEKSNQEADQRHNMSGVIKGNSVADQTRRDDKHAKSLTLSNPVKKSIDPMKSLSSHQGGGHLSPAEFFQMSRLRASALANKLNTSATYGGSKDLVTNVSAPTATQLMKTRESDKENDGKTDSVVDDLAKAVEDVKLLDKEKKSENKDKSQAGDGELIGRSPVPVYSNNRHVQHPYKQSGSKYPAPQAAPIPGYCQLKGPDGAPVTPGDYLQQQRMRAATGQYPQHPGHSAHQQQAQNGPCMVYPQQHAMDDGQRQGTPHQGMYSPGDGYAMQQSPCEMRRYNNATPPAGSWPQENMGHHMPAPGSCSPMSANSPDDSQGGSYPMVISPFEAAATTGAADRSMNMNEELNQFFQQSKASKQKSGAGANERHMANKNVDELPEALCDFILKYSRRYSNSSNSSSAVTSARDGYGNVSGDDMSSGCVSGEPSPISSGGRRASDSSLSGASGDESGVEDDHMSSISARSSQPGGRPDSCQSAVFVDSPLSAGGCGSVPPNSSPAAPLPSQMTTKIEEKSICGKYRPLRPKQPQLQPAQPQSATQPMVIGQSQAGGKARQRLREMIQQHEFDAAWAWAMRCCQACPGSLMFRDVDGDSLLHIVVWHKDMAKIYAVTEILMKEDHFASTKPIDMPNKLDETPLFLAVEKRTADVVAYLLECGANPNLRARNHDGDAPLHYAAARGMSEIVQLFCASTKTNFNLLNGSGMTPLLCAVKNHGVIEEESQCLVNNKPTIRTLLKVGADSKIPDVASGKSVLHYCVERMDPDLVELFREHLSKEAMSQLVNMPDYNGDTPLHILSRMAGESPTRNSTASQFARAEGEEELRRKMLNTLIDCGADASQCAGGMDDNGGSYILRYTDVNQDANDDIQFTILDSELVAEKY